MAVVEGRNFRSHYYEKVGFRGVEEKKSLDKLLGERPIDKEKVQNFCLRYVIPGIYRSCVWRTLLGVLPLFASSREWAWQQRVEQYADLLRAITITRHLSNNPEQNVAIVWLLNRNRLKFDVAGQLGEAEVVNFTLIAKKLSEILETTEEVFWVGMKLHEFLNKHVTDRAVTSECLAKLLRGEDTEVHQHLERNNLLVDLCCPHLLGTGLSLMFAPSLLSKLWDKVAAGSAKVLLFTLCGALLHFRTQVLESTSAEEVFLLLRDMSEPDQEEVFQRGQEVWELEGCPLLLVPQADGKAEGERDGGRSRRPSRFGGGHTENRISRELSLQ